MAGNDTGNRQLAAGKGANNPTGIQKLLAQWSRQGIPLDEVIICFEHTGPYGLLLAAMLEEAGIRYVMVAAAQIQRSLGIRRGKSDPIDAGRLAEYEWRFRDRLRPSRLPSKALLELRAYYQRKCAEGKHPQSVRNAVCCKLLYRVFAVINRGTPYVKIYQHQAPKY